MMKMLGLFCLISCSWIVPSSYTAHLSDAWYPSRAKPLRIMLQNLQDQAQKKYPCHVQSSEIKALLVPHAGYEYSGLVATSAYQNIVPGTFQRIIILAPSHHGAFQGVALPGIEYDSFKNSLGKVALDVKTLKALRQDPSCLFAAYSKVHDSEHSIEVQIPFIQKYCGECMIVPLLIGSVSDDQMRKIAQVLLPYVDDTTLLIVSSDLTHYGASFGYTPFSSNIGRQIVHLDDQLMEKIQKLDSAGLIDLKQSTGATVCGIYPIAVLLNLLKLLKLPLCSYLTGYDRSSGQQDNPDHSVSYAGVVFSQQFPEKLPLADRLTGYEKNILRNLVQSSLSAIFSSSSLSVIQGLNSEGVAGCVPLGILTQSLRTPQAAFVTLYSPGHVLRGCIGTVHADKPLYEVVCRMARSAALDDRRFQPVSQSELADITFSVSVLTQPKKVASYRDVVVGVDGVILKHGIQSALFLPKVASEFGWDLTTMLQQLCLKAGLGKDAFKDEKAQFEVFQTIDF